MGIPCCLPLSLPPPPQHPSWESVWLALDPSPRPPLSHAGWWSCVSTAWQGCCCCRARRQRRPPATERPLPSSTSEMAGLSPADSRVGRLPTMRIGSLSTRGQRGGRRVQTNGAETRTVHTQRAGSIALLENSVRLSKRSTPPRTHTGTGRTRSGSTSCRGYTRCTTWPTWWTLSKAPLRGTQASPLPLGTLSSGRRSSSSGVPGMDAVRAARSPPGSSSVGVRVALGVAAWELGPGPGEALSWDLHQCTPVHCTRFSPVAPTELLMQE